MNRWFISILFLIALVIFVVHSSEVESFVELIQQMDPLWFMLAILFQLGTYCSMAAVWWFALWKMNEKCDFFQLFLLSFSELFINQTVPTSGLSGTAVVAKFLLQRQVSHPATALAIALNIFGRQVAYLLAFMVAIIILWIHHPLSKSMDYLAIFFSIIMLLLLIALIYSWVWATRNAAPSVLARFPSVYSLFIAIKELHPSILLNLKIMLPSLLLLLLVFAFDGLTLWTILYAFGIEDLSFALVFACQVISSAIATLSFMPGGLGIYEGSLTAILHLSGLSIESAFTATILFRGFTYWLPMLPGFFITQREAKRGSMGR